jgi:hypothetical protein
VVCHGSRIADPVPIAIDVREFDGRRH